MGSLFWVSRKTPWFISKILNANLYARIKHEVLAARQRRILGANSEAEREGEMRQRARLLSAGGGSAHSNVLLHIPPKTARWGLPNISFPGHLFGIALRPRMGLPLKDRMQGNRKCRCKVERHQNGGSAMGPTRDDHLAHTRVSVHFTKKKLKQ